MSISLQLLLSDYERARAVGDSTRASAIFKQMEKIGLPGRLKPKPRKRQAARGTKPAKSNSSSDQTGVKIDPGRF